MKNACTFTGPKPTRFKFKYNEAYKLCKKIKKSMLTQMKRLYNEKGVRRFYITSAIGVHMWAGELALQLKSQTGFEDLELIVVQPFPEYDRQWDVKSRKRMEFLIRNSTECIIIGKSVSQGNYVLANRYLVDHAQFLIAVSEHAGDLPSDMTQMEAYAYQKSLGMIFIHPDTVEVKGAF